MANQLELLKQLIGAAPEPMKPSLNQIGNMMEANAKEFTGHVGDNMNDMSRLESLHTANSERLASVTNGLSQAQQSLVDMSARLDTIEKNLASPSSIDNSLSFQRISAELDMLKVQTLTNQKDLEDGKGMRALLKETEAKIEENFYAFGNTNVKHVDGQYRPTIDELTAKMVNAEQFFTQQREKLLEVEGVVNKLPVIESQINELIRALEANPAQNPVLLQQLAAKTDQIEEQLDKLQRNTSSHKEQGFKGCLADAKRCGSMGVLGTQGVDFEQWCDLVETLVSEKYSSGPALLKWAKLQGSEEVTAETLEEQDLEEDEDTMKQINRDLFGLLQQQTKGNLWTAIKNCKGRGLEAWRRLHYSCNPKNPASAEALRKQLVAERPSTSVAQLRQ